MVNIPDRIIIGERGYTVIKDQPTIKRLNNKYKSQIKASNGRTMIYVVSDIRPWMVGNEKDVKPFIIEFPVKLIYTNVEYIFLNQ